VLSVELLRQRFQARASDVEVLFKTVWLEEVGEFESAEKT